MSRLINPVPQFLDGNGDPVVAGLLFFYEAGTNTFKNTYADIDQSVLNTNPVELDTAGRVPSVFYDGVARVVLKDADNVQIWEADNVGQGDIFDQFSEWKNFIIYDEYDFVRKDGLFYQSSVSGNQGNDPSTSSAEWSEVRFLGTYSASAEYNQGDTVRTDDGNLWKSESSENQGNDPLTDGGVNWSPAVAGASIAEVGALEVRTTTCIEQSGGGVLVALRVNSLTDSSTYTLPAANSVSDNQWIDIEIEENHKAEMPTVQSLGTDDIVWSQGADSEILFDSGESIALRLYSNGINAWRI